MRYREFGRDGIQVSEVGLGTWQLGSDWGKVGDDEAREILREALRQGINFFDTADVYGPEVSERRIGRFLKGRPERVIVATKLGRFPRPGWPGNFTLEAMRAHTEASLRRLGIEALDLTQLHCIPRDEMAEGEVFEHLRTLRNEGKILRFGASVESVEEAHICLEQEDLYSLQVIFNVFRRKPADELFQAARGKGVALVVRVPLASGLLAGRFSADSAFPENDHRNYNRDGAAFNVGETFAGLPLETGVALAERIKPWVPAGTTMAQMALRWILDFPEIGVVIPGATRPEQVVSNAAASDLPPLGAEIHRAMEQLYETEVFQHIRGPY
jgi:aryl-alcohol dehydrogenase-like predicted oxidoreductase